MPSPEGSSEDRSGPFSPGTPRVCPREGLSGGQGAASLLPPADGEGKRDKVWKLLWLEGLAQPGDRKEVSGVLGIMAFPCAQGAEFFPPVLQAGLGALSGRLTSVAELQFFNGPLSPPPD